VEQAPRGLVGHLEDPERVVDEGRGALARDEADRLAGGTGIEGDQPALQAPRQTGEERGIHGDRQQRALDS
jgi:hypothetical protein